MNNDEPLLKLMFLNDAGEKICVKTSRLATFIVETDSFVIKREWPIQDVLPEEPVLSITSKVDGKQVINVGLAS